MGLNTQEENQWGNKETDENELHQKAQKTFTFADVWLLSVFALAHIFQFASSPTSETIISILSLWAVGR